MLSMLTALLVATAPAAEEAHPSWSELEPWRTWVVVDHVTEAQHVFVMQETPGVGGRCEVVVAAGRPELDPVVTCGLEGHSTVGARPVEGRARAASKRALAALSTYTQKKPGELRRAGLTWLGELRRVSFRELVVTVPHDDPSLAETRTLRASWDVDMQTGRVLGSAVAPEVGRAPLCARGLHPGCDAPPRLVAWTPPPRWEGMLADADDGDAGESLAAAIRAVAEAEHAGGWSADERRTVSAGLLPEAYEAGVALDLHVRARSGGEATRGRTFRLDMPLSEAAFGPVSVRLPVDGVAAELELDLDLPGRRLVARIRPKGSRYVQMEAPIRCDLVVDDARAALTSSCQVDWVGRWLSWVGPGGGDQVLLQVGELAEPMTVPSSGPALLPDEG